ncbi:MAG: hypothetical protein QXK24_06485 [Ignisphaera sp.]
MRGVLERRVVTQEYNEPTIYVTKDEYSKYIGVVKSIIESLGRQLNPNDSIDTITITTKMGEIVTFTVKVE